MWRLPSWRVLAALLALWWLGATVGDALIEREWTRDAQGIGSANASAFASTSGLDFALAHARLHTFRWGATLLGALICGGWAWRQGRLAVANARESEASLGALWSVGEDGQPMLPALEAQQTGRWIPLEDKLALDRFRPLALNLGVGACALAGAILGGRSWLLWLDAWAARDIGTRDPWLGLDVSFYLFRLPALDFAWRLLLVAQWMALALSLAIYLYEDSLQVGRRLWASRRALRHLAVLLALLLAWKAVGTLLYPFELLVRRSPTWSGPHALDWGWRVPLNFAGAAFTLLCAALCLREGKREEPAGVLKWALAPVLACWLLVNAVPTLRRVTMSSESLARADAPFAQAQSQWTRRALGFEPAPNPETASSSEPAQTATLAGARMAERAREALSMALSERDLAAPAPGTGDEEATSVSLLASSPRVARLETDVASTGASTSTSTRAKRLALAWQQAEPGEFAPRGWEQRHVDARPSVAWKLFDVEPARITTAEGAPVVEIAPSGSRQEQRDERELPVLVGLDAAASPRLLRDAEVARSIATGARLFDVSRLPWPARLPGSFFDTSFSSTSRLASRSRAHALPAFQVLNVPAFDASRDASRPRPERNARDASSTNDSASNAPASPVTDDVPKAGVVLDAPWKRWLAAWKMGSLALAWSPRVDESSRLAWRLDASDRCRRLAPFLSWPDAPRPLRDEQGRLFWLLDGYTLSAAFPLARPLDTASAFAAPNLRAQALAAVRAARSRVSSSRAAPLGLAMEDGALESQASIAARILEREEVLSRLSSLFDGFNWARASVAALVEARTGRVRFFALDESDVILSLYRRALPEMWSPASALPPFARAATRTPLHLAALQSAAWANSTQDRLAGTAQPQIATPQGASRRTPDTSEASWRVCGTFLLPTADGLRTGVRLTLSDPASTSTLATTSASGASGAAVALAPVRVALGPGQAALGWQTHIFAPGSPATSALTDALIPLSPEPNPPRWLARRVASPTSSHPRTGTSAWVKRPAPPASQSAAGWRQARDLWQSAQRARASGDPARHDELSRRLGRLLNGRAP